MTSGNQKFSDVPDPQAIREQLRKIIASPNLQSSERRIEFLKFIVEESIAGRDSKLKGYSIAVAVYGRDETFDAQTDPVVRIEARRLRRDLDSYYVAAGIHDPIRISIPKGSYVPRFEWLHENASRSELGADAELTGAGTSNGAAGNLIPKSFPVGRLAVLGFLAASLAVLLTAWVLSGHNKQPAGANLQNAPNVVVQPFQPLGSTVLSEHLAIGVTQQLIGDLMQFPGFRVFNPSNGLRDSLAPSANPPLKPSGPVYIVGGSILDEADNVHLAAWLLRGESGEVLWTANYDHELTPAALYDVQRQLSSEVASEIGQPYGAINTDLVRQSPAPAVSSVHSYVCVVRAYMYRRSFSSDEFVPVHDCLEEAVQRDPQYADAWAMLGWLHLDAGRYDFSGDNSILDDYDAALDAASRAVALEPDNTLALKALASILHYRGDFEESERLARRAAALNPNDPDTLAQLGWRLAARGNFEEGIPLLERAIERTPNPPGWYFHLLAINSLMSGDYEAMLVSARHSAVDGSPFSQALIAIAAAHLDYREEAIDALVKVSQSKPLANDPEAYIRRHQPIDAIVDSFVFGLQDAQNYAEHPAQVTLLDSHQ